MLNITDAFPEEPYTALDQPLQVKVDGIFTQRSVKPTSAFSFRTFDAHRFEIDTHRTYKLGPMNAALRVELLQIIQESEMVGDVTAYHVLLRSQYPLYAGDVLFLEAPPQAA